MAQKVVGSHRTERKEAKEEHRQYSSSGGLSAKVYL